MFFLMNNYILDLDLAASPPGPVAHRFRNLSLDFVSRLGAELFVEQPVLPHSGPEQARRLAMLIRSQAPSVNAALFVLPALNCRPEQVQVRYAEVSIDVMALLWDRQQSGMLTTLEADRLVWRRLAA